MAWNPLDYFREHHLPESYPAPRLYEILHYDYALLGAYPLRGYLPQRATYSLDILTDSISRAETEKALREISWKEDYFSNTHSYYLLKNSNLYVTLLTIDAPWVPDALNASRTNLDPFSTEPTFPFEWLILSKMDFGKRQDYMDCARLISRANEEQISKTKELLDYWLPSALPTLRKLYTVGKEELKHAPADKKIYQNQETRYNSWHHMSAEQHRYLDTDWKALVDQPGLDLLTTAGEWPDSRVDF